MRFFGFNGFFPVCTKVCLRNVKKVPRIDANNGFDLGLMAAAVQHLIERSAFTFFPALLLSKQKSRLFRGTIRFPLHFFVNIFNIFSLFPSAMCSILTAAVAKPSCSILSGDGIKVAAIVEEGFGSCCLAADDRAERERERE